MKQYVDLNIEIVVGVAIAILVRGSPSTPFCCINGLGLSGPRNSANTIGEFLFSIYYIHNDYKIFYIEEKVILQAVACSDSK